MVLRTLAAALALLLTLGDMSWAGPVVRTAVRGPSAPSGADVAGTVSLPATGLGLNPATFAPAPLLAPVLGAAPSLAAPNVVPLAAPLASPSAAADAPAAASQLDAAAATPAPAAQRDAAAASSDGAKRWDAAGETAPGDGSEVVAPAGGPVSNGLSPAGPLAAPAAKGIPPPRVGLARAKHLGAWLALAGIGALAGEPFERVGLLVLGAVMGLALGAMGAFYVYAAQNEQGWGGGPSLPDRPIPDDERESARAQIDGLAAEAGLPAVRKYTFKEHAGIDAQAGGNVDSTGQADGSQVVVAGGVLDLPEGPRRAVLRHEIAHVKHGDSSWSGFNLIMTAVPASLGLVAGMAGDARALVALPLFVASLYLLGETRKRDEYHADQYAAHRDGSPEHMVGALRAIQVQEEAYRPGPPPTAFHAAARRVSNGWRTLRQRVWGTHPTHEQRIARLERLAR